MREALTNLVLNAIDAVPQGGTITIRTECDAKWVTVVIGDTGIGMTEDVKKHVFEPFFTTKGNRGTGMGLAVTHGIIRAQGGLIAFKSESGKGTVFEIHFPRRHAEAGEVVPAAKARENLGPISVLIVDDEQWSREVMRRFLMSEGHSVAMAESGATGLAAFRKEKFDLVICDWAMPDMSGEQVAMTIKKMRPDVPILLVTGFGEIMKDSGEEPEYVDGILSKPVTLEDLRECVAKLMGGASQSTQP